MKKIKVLLVFVAVCIVCLGISSCFSGRLAWADDSVMRTNGLSVAVTDTTQTKAFVLGVDSEERIEKFGEFGELRLICVTVSGTVQSAGLATSGTAMTIDGDSVHVTGSSETASYYTDWFKLKIKLPQDATKLNKLDGNGPQIIDTVASVSDGFYFENVEWLYGDANAENWTINGNSETNDLYLYYGFTDDSNNVLAEYFVRVIYDITFE